jgi:hypothetical protein
MNFNLAAIRTMTCILDKIITVPVTCFKTNFNSRHLSKSSEVQDTTHDGTNYVKYKNKILLVFYTGHTWRSFQCDSVVVREFTLIHG